MTKPSTIAVINAINNGQDPKALFDVKLGGPDAPYRKKANPVKVVPSMTEAQLAERERIYNLLQSGRWIVEFTKADGTASIMECTLDPTFLPPAYPVATGTRVEQKHLLHVYAIDRQGWRSFVVNNVKRVYRAG